LKGVVSVANVNAVRTRPMNQDVNKAGGVGYSLSAKSELVSLLLTSLAEDKYYERADAQTTRLMGLMGQVDPLFAAKAAIYARDTFGMRSITHLAAAALAGASFPEKRAFYRAVVVRPDDALSILAAYGVDGKPIPNAMKRGIADKLAVFKPETLAKYKSTDREVNMYDAINLVHPKSAAVNAFMNGTISSADTWEVALSASKDKAASWRSLVLENKLGIMALLRNLRNIIENCERDSEVMNAVAVQLTDTDAIMRSRLFPYRFLAAYQTFMGNNRYGSFGVRAATAPQKILTAINRAAEISLVNVPELEGSTGLLLDISGSMHTTMSDKSQMRMVDAGAMLGAMLFKKNPDSELVKFGTHARKFSVNADMPLLEIAKFFATGDGLGCGTNLPSGFDALSGKHDRVIIVSDMQTWMRYGGQRVWSGYNRRTGANSFGYEIDLGGYGQTALQNRDSREFHLSTISDKVFLVMNGLETGGAGLVETIEKVTF